MIARIVSTAIKLAIFGLSLSIAQVSTANASNLTIDTDKVESLLEITDIVEKEALKSIDFTQYSLLSNSIMKEFWWSPDGSKLLIRTDVALRIENASKEDKTFFRSCSDSPFGPHVVVTSLFWINADGSEFTGIARAEETIKSARNNTYAAITSAGWDSDGDKILFQVSNGCKSDEKDFSKFYVSDRKGSIFAEMKVTGSPFVHWNNNRSRGAVLDGEGEKSRISIIDVENSTVKQLSPGISIQSYIGSLKWRPGGNELAFRDYKNKNIYTVDADDYSVKQLTSGTDLSWKPDGKKLIYTTEDGIYSIDADGSNPSLVEKGNFHLVRMGTQWSLEPWSPDGRKIVLGSRSSEKDNREKLYVLVFDEAATKLLSPESDSGKYSIFDSWSPDGKKLLFKETDGRSIDKLLVFDIDSGTTKLIASASDTESVNIGSTAWSPDGSRIHFGIGFASTGKSVKYTVNSDGTDKVTLPENYFAEMEGAYGWGTDRIYYLTKDSLVKANPDGTEQPIVKNISTNIYSSNEMSLSPDGSKILLTVGNMLKRERNSNSYILKLKGYDEVMSIYASGSIKQGDAALIEVKSMSKPVEKAVITLNGKEIGITNETGFLKYRFNEAGTYRLSVAKQGFRTANNSIIVKEASPEPAVTTTATPAPAVVENTPQSPGFSSIFTVCALILTIYQIKKIRRLK